MSYRSSLSRTLHGSLESDADHETNVDRLTAFSLATRLGTLLYRLKYDLDSSVHNEALASLSATAGVSVEVSACAIHEWLSDSCQRCNGAATLIAGEKWIDCPACKNHPGRHRFSDQARAGYLRVSLSTARRMSRAIRKAHDTIGTYDRGVSGTMAAHLKD